MSSAKSSGAFRAAVAVAEKGAEVQLTLYTRVGRTESAAGGIVGVDGVVGRRWRGWGLWRGTHRR